MSRTRQHLGAIAVLAGLTAWNAGCGGGGAVDPSRQAATTLDSIAVTPPSVTLGVGGTMPLTVAAFSPAGQIVAGAAPSFSSTSEAVATVDAAGTVRAAAVGNALINVSVTLGGVTRTAQVPVSVTTAPATQAAIVTTPDRTFSPAQVTIVPGNTVVWQMSEETHNVTFGAIKPQGGDVPNTPPGGGAARVFVTAGSYDYQCTLHSGMTGRVVVDPAGGPPGVPPGTAPSGIVNTTVTRFNPETIEIRPGGTILWQFSGAVHNVIFEDIAPPGGNIPESPPGTSATREFPAAGDYDYLCSIHAGMKGRIRVR